MSTKSDDIDERTALLQYVVANGTPDIIERLREGIVRLSIEPAPEHDDGTTVRDMTADEREAYFAFAAVFFAFMCGGTIDDGIRAAATLQTFVERVWNKKE